MEEGFPHGGESLQVERQVAYSRDLCRLLRVGRKRHGTRIEVVQDSAKLGVHHLHLRGADPAAMLAWYSAQFGGRVAKLKDRIDGIDLSGVWLLVQRGDAVPSAGHSIDHIGFRPLDVDAAVAELKTRNVKITTDPRPLSFPNGVTVRLAFAEAPDGVRIELVQRPE